MCHEARRGEEKEREKERESARERGVRAIAATNTLSLVEKEMEAAKSDHQPTVSGDVVNALTVDPSERTMV